MRRDSLRALRGLKLSSRYLNMFVHNLAEPQPNFSDIRRLEFFSLGHYGFMVDLSSVSINLVKDSSIAIMSTIRILIIACCCVGNWFPSSLIISIKSLL